MLTKIKFAPGIDKQDTSVGAEGRWVDSDKYIKKALDNDAKFSRFALNR